MSVFLSVFPFVACPLTHPHAPLFVLHVVASLRRYCEAHGGNFWSGAKEKSLLATCAECFPVGKVKRCRCAVCKAAFVQRKAYMKHFKVILFTVTFCANPANN